ncbi:MAG: methyltransferase domain-containing protein [Planctomycetota bacterium]|nr:MAG: methyltransferase domain-containing protein [Planctomycetota bacterium]
MQGGNQIDPLASMDLQMGGKDWKPTPHGRFMGEVLAETDFLKDKEVLELGAGIGNHTILLLQKEVKHLTATEILPELLESAKINVERNLPPPLPIDYRVADWLDLDGKFDAIVTNPPFCKSGKQNRRYFIDSLILDGHKHLHPNGELVFVQSSMADLDKTESRLRENGYEPEILGQQSGPFRDYYFEDASFMREIQEVPNGFYVENGVHYETLSVIRAVLQPFSPPEGAHIFEP